MVGRHGCRTVALRPRARAEGRGHWVDKFLPSLRTFLFRPPPPPPRSPASRACLRTIATGPSFPRVVSRSRRFRAPGARRTRGASGFSESQWTAHLCRPTPPRLGPSDPRPGLDPAPNSLRLHQSQTLRGPAESLIPSAGPLGPYQSRPRPVGPLSWSTPPRLCHPDPRP